MAFEFLQHEPDGALTPFVESLWFARGTMPYARELIAPTGSTVVVLILGPSMVVTADRNEGPTEFSEGYVLGPHDRPVVNEPTGETIAAGVVTTPVGCRAVLGVDPAPLRGLVRTLGDVGGRASSLRDVVASSGDAASRLAAMEALLLAGLEPHLPSVDLAADAVRLLVDDPRRAVADVATELGVSNGHLHRVVTHVVGLSPASVRRILRMRRLLEVADEVDGPNWTTLAAEFGWYDQSHFTRDFRRHTGVAPSEYRRLREQHLDAEDRTPGFVPHV